MVVVEIGMADRLNFVSMPWQSERYRVAVDLRHRVLRLPLGLSFSDADLESERPQLHFAAIMDDDLVGCLVVDMQPSGIAKLRQMAVEPKFQRAGVGTFLVRKVESELIKQKVIAIKLHARKTAVGFYESLGYESQEGEFIEVTLPHLMMTKQLRS